PSPTFPTSCRSRYRRALQGSREDAHGSPTARAQRAPPFGARFCRCDDGARSGPGAGSRVRSAHRAVRSPPRVARARRRRRGDVIAPKLVSALRRSGRIATERPHVSAWTLVAATCALFVAGAALLAADS